MWKHRSLVEKWFDSKWWTKTWAAIFGKHNFGCGILVALVDVRKYFSNSFDLTLSKWDGDITLGPLNIVQILQLHITWGKIEDGKLKVMTSDNLFKFVSFVNYWVTVHLLCVKSYLFQNCSSVQSKLFPNKLQWLFTLLQGSDD